MSLTVRVLQMLLAILMAPSKWAPTNGAPMVTTAAIPELQDPWCISRFVATVSMRIAEHILWHNDSIAGDFYHVHRGPTCEYANRDRASKATIEPLDCEM